MAERIDNSDFPTLSHPEDGSADGGHGSGSDLLKLRKGDRIGDFEILEEIGRGGMGVVYKAYEMSLKRVVALKVLNPDILSDPNATKRFRHEAILAANLSHPNIVPVFQVETGEFPRYFTMEFINGISLKDKVEAEGFLKPEQVVRIALQACEALQYAHDCSIIHRDIKPSNILLQNHVERVRITDFGIAQDMISRLTDSTEIDHSTPGTLAFESPEQTLGQKCDCRSDIFSLGMTLYYVLTGEVAYKGDNRAQMALAFSEQTPPPPSCLNPEVSHGFDEIILRMINISPQQRPSTLREVRATIQNLSAGDQVASTSLNEIAKKYRFWLIGLVLLCLAFLVVAIEVTTRVFPGKVGDIESDEKRGLRSSNVPDAEPVDGHSRPNKTGAWEPLYQSDFSNDPAWTTNSPERFFWDPSDGTYHLDQVNINYAGNYGYVFTQHDGGSFRLRYDIQMVSTDYASAVSFGLYDSDLNVENSGSYAEVAFIEEDRGHIVVLNSCNQHCVSKVDVSTWPQFSLGTWYRVVVSYDQSSQTLEADIISRDTGTSLIHLSISGAGPFASDTCLLGNSNIRNDTFQVPGAHAAARIDNVSLERKSTAGISKGPVLSDYRWHEYKGHRYALTLDYCDWATAQRWAREVGGHLAVIDDDAENAWIAETFKGTGVRTQEANGQNSLVWIDLVFRTGDMRNPQDWEWFTTGRRLSWSPAWWGGRPKYSPVSARHAYLHTNTHIMPGSYWNNDAIDTDPNLNPLGVVEIDSR